MSSSWLANIDASVKASLFTNHSGEKRRNFHDRRGAQIKVKSSRWRPELVQLQVMEPGRLLELLADTASGLLMKKAG